jgi:hypothetical protein
MWLFSRVSFQTMLDLIEMSLAMFRPPLMYPDGHPLQGCIAGSQVVCQCSWLTLCVKLNISIQNLAEENNHSQLVVDGRGV